MHIYVFRVIKRKLASFCFSVFSLALAVASLIACLTIYQTLISGKPIGTHYQGDEVSLFTYAPSYKLSFTLSPRTILNLATDLGANGKIIASSGARLKDVIINNAIVNSAVDTVSDNFFDVLKIKFIQGNINGFAGEQPTCLLAQSYIEKLDLDIDSLPLAITIANKSYKVIGVVDTFKGLLDAETEVWVPWQHGHNILFPALTDKGLLRQPDLYRTVIISNTTNDNKFRSAIQQLKSRTDLLYPPMDSFKSIRGISWSEKKHGSAKQSTQLYLYISLLIFVVSVLNLSTWISLTRFSKIADELTFLKLGIKQATYLNYHLLLAVIPVACAFIVAYPIYYWYLHLLQQEPAIADLFLYSAEFDKPSMGKYILLMLVLTLAITYMISWLIAKISAVGFFVTSFKQKTKSVPIIFRSMMLLASILATISLIFALFTTQYGINAISLFKINPKPVYFSGIHSTKELNKQSLANYLNAIKQNNPAIKQLGIIQYAPLLNISLAQGFSLEEYGDPNVSIVVNPTNLGALSALDIKLTNGGWFADDESNQIVVDEKTEEQLKKLTGKTNILGLKLYDPSSDAYTIMGVASNINYSDNPTTETFLAYTGFGVEKSNGILVIKGGIAGELEMSLIEINKQFNFKPPQVKSYYQLSKDKRDPYISRLLLCIIAALVAILISSLTLFSIANLDIQYRTKTLAIYSCLGLTSLKLWWQANKTLILIIIVGFFIGMLLFWSNSHNPVLQIIITKNTWPLVAFFSFIFMLFISVASITFAFWRIFANKPLYNHLKCDE